jgi:hypothetical protein
MSNILRLRPRFYNCHLATFHAHAIFRDNVAQKVDLLKEKRAFLFLKIKFILLQ